MARARRRKSIQSNKLTYYIIGAAVLILIIFAFPNVGKFTATVTDSGSGVEIELTTPDQEIAESYLTGVINFTFRNVQDFDTLSFETYIPNGALVFNGIRLRGGPLTSSNTNVVIGGDSQFGTNATTLNFQGTNGVNISEQNISLLFSKLYTGTNLSKIVISNTLFGDSNGNAIALFSNISRHNVVPANLPPTVRIHSPSSGSSWLHNESVFFNVTAVDPDGSITNLTLLHDGLVYIWPFHPVEYRITADFLGGTLLGNHTFRVVATDNSGATTSNQVSFNVYNATVPTPPTNQTQGNQTQGNQTNQTTNIPPVAVISSPQAGQTYTLGDSIFLNGTGSYDTDGSISSYEFQVGISCGLGCQINATVYTGATHSLNANSLGPGSYTVHLIVHDNDGARGVQLDLPLSITSLGDVNGDGRITGADVTASEWLSVGVNRNYVIQNADTNQDGSRNSLDITGVERILLS